ncbi:MAG: PDR/VanB family oxidoreductase [Ottowia sp.]|uniref:PDR/VanB family oxidoreductase n=1 Tax=Ottowia sp. TaxID=1898956 RepID=UPI003C78D1A7
MTPLSLHIRQIRLEANDTLSFDLAAPDGAELPSFSAGSHIDIQIPGGPRRSYSLTGASNRRDRYRIAVKHAQDSRGGSRWLHESARVGMALEVHGPRNQFELAEDASFTVLVAGGIGITPLLPMAARLSELKRPWALHYTTRRKRDLAFERELRSLETLGHGKVHLHCTAEGDARLDPVGIARQAPLDSHVYVCGPQSLIDATLEACASRPSRHVHHERFNATQAPATNGSYELVLARSGRRLPVAAGRTMLDTLLEAGIDVPFSCTQGICGSCRVDVIGGSPDHRDEYLSDDERESGRCVMACCSGSHSPELTLDL